MPFICLTPTAGEWLRVCFDVDTNHVSTLKDDKGVPVAFKLVIDVYGQGKGIQMDNSVVHHMMLNFLTWLLVCVCM